MVNRRATAVWDSNFQKHKKFAKNASCGMCQFSNSTFMFFFLFPVVVIDHFIVFQAMYGSIVSLQVDKERIILSQNLQTKEEADFVPRKVTTTH